MIASLRGVFLERWGDGSVIVEVSGVGYRLVTTASTVVEMGETGSEVFVYVFHHVREDAETLFGFSTRDERVCFEALLGAHGVGPSLALAILSVHSPLDLRRILLDEDADALCLVPGVGRKTASRLLIELKSRLDIPELSEDARQPAGPSERIRRGPSATADVREALVNLGYTNEDIVDVMRDLPDVDDSAQLLREALQRLAVG